MDKNPPQDTGKKKKLFEAAARLFAEKGFEKTTVDEITEAAAVAKGTVYYYFKGKEDIFLFLIDEAMAILKQRLNRALAGIEEETPAILEKLVQVHLAFFTDYWDVCRVILAEAWGSLDRQQRLQELLTEYYALIGGYFLRGMEEGAIRRQDPEVLAVAFFGMTAVTALHFLGKPTPVDWNDIENRLCALFFGGAKP